MQKTAKNDGAKARRRKYMRIEACPAFKSKLSESEARHSAGAHAAAEASSGRLTKFK